MQKYDTVIIGAGASGLVAAGRAAELGAKVLLLEKKERAGRKLLITGKGRCNITNTAYMSEFFKKIHPKSKFLKSAFSKFFSKDIIQLFEDYGLEVKTERGGRVFPVSDNATDVVKALLKYVTKTGKVTIVYNANVLDILTDNKIVSGVKYQKNDNDFNVETKSVIVATGGKSYPATGSNGDGYRLAKKHGHTIENVRPALVPIETELDLVKDIQGLSLKNVTASIWVNGKKVKEDFGEMIFTHFGVSGPIILTLSRLIVDEFQKNNKVEISIDLKPALDQKKLDTRLQRDLNENGKKQVQNIFKLWLPSKLIPVFIKHLAIKPYDECNQLSAKQRNKIRSLMKEFRLKVTGFRPFKEAIITAGGISTNEISSKTMESKIVKNLFFAGELVDLDADTGGYNLQIAYSTAWVAAEAVAENINAE